MSEDMGYLIFGAVVAIFGIAFSLFAIFCVFRQMWKDMRKVAEKRKAAQLFQPAAERMRGKEGEVMTWEFERRREDVTARVKDRLEMAVDCYVTVEHLVGWQRQMHKRKKLFQWRSLFTWLRMPVLLLLLGLYGLLRGEWNWTLLTVLFSSAAFLFCSPWLARWSAGATVRRHAKLKALFGIGPRRLLLTPDALFEIDEQATKELPWRNVQRIESEGAYTMFYLAPGWGWLFAKESFTSPEEYERFIVVAKECWSRTRPAEGEPQPFLLPLDPAALLPSAPSQDIRK